MNEYESLQRPKPTCMYMFMYMYMDRLSLLKQHRSLLPCRKP